MLKDKKYRILCILLVFLFIPVLILFGIVVLDDRKYYFISVIMIFVTMVPFILFAYFHEFNSKRLLVIASLSAIAVLGRVAFFMLPQFKPVVAVVMISSIILGPMEGFMVGILSGFVSNFYFGQGPWTVWQMFCFGIVGFLSGVILRKHNKLKVCITGFILTFLVYGGIMNFASVVMFYSNITVSTLKLSYIAGIPFDLIHAVATSVFLFFIYRPFTEKLLRLREKYGI